MYEYKAKIVRVVDADTFYLDVDLGFHITHRINVRLARVDAWEIRGEEKEWGFKAKTFVEGLFFACPEVLIKTEKTGKFGRWIAEVEFPAYGNLSDLLVERGLAVAVD